MFTMCLFASVLSVLSIDVYNVFVCKCVICAVYICVQSVLSVLSIDVYSVFVC